MLLKHLIRFCAKYKGRFQIYCRNEINPIWLFFLSQMLVPDYFAWNQNLYHFTTNAIYNVHTGPGTSRSVTSLIPIFCNRKLFMKCTKWRAFNIDLFFCEIMLIFLQENSLKHMKLVHKFCKTPCPIFNNNNNKNSNL